MKRRTLNVQLPGRVSRSRTLKGKDGRNSKPKIKSRAQTERRAHPTTLGPRRARLRQPERRLRDALKQRIEKRARRSNHVRRPSARCSTRFDSRSTDFESAAAHGGSRVQLRSGVRVEQDRSHRWPRSTRLTKARATTIIKAEYRNIAERRVRLGLLLAEIGRRHKLEVSDRRSRPQAISKIASTTSSQAKNAR